MAMVRKCMMQDAQALTSAVLKLAPQFFATKRKNARLVSYKKILSYVFQKTTKQSYILVMKFY
jgi:hypothetical protein